MTQRSYILPLDYSLNGYRIGPELGSGGFGVTYRAVHESQPERLVAIKEYFPQVLSCRDPDGIGICPNTQGRKSIDSGEQSYYHWGLSRFLDEARILAEIDHPQVVRVRDHFTANGSAYIVMDYEEGEPLSALLNRETVLPEDRLRRLLDELLAALEAVHAQGYLHRDLKPDNIYLRTDGSAMLIDFGAARQALFHHSHTITGLITAGYSPPEQYATQRGDRYGPWTDIYALGAILYRCISGQTPLPATDRLLGDTLPPILEVGLGRYSPGLLAAVDRALVIDPQQRFQSVAQLRAALLYRGAETLIPAGGPAFGAPSTAGFAAPAGRLAAPTTKKRWAVSAAIALLSLTAAGAGVVLEQGWNPIKAIQGKSAPQPAAPLAFTPAATEVEPQPPEPQRSGTDAEQAGRRAEAIPTAAAASVPQAASPEPRATGWNGKKAAASPVKAQALQPGRAEPKRRKSAQDPRPAPEQQAKAERRAPSDARGALANHAAAKPTTTAAPEKLRKNPPLSTAKAKENADRRPPAGGGGQPVAAKREAPVTVRREAPVAAAPRVQPPYSRSVDEDWSRIYRQPPPPVRAPQYPPYRGPVAADPSRERLPSPPREYARREGPPPAWERRNDPRLCRPGDACRDYPARAPYPVDDGTRRTTARRNGLLDVLEDIRRDIQRQLGIPLPRPPGLSSDEDS